MKLSNQNICNLRGCQMPLGVQIISGGAHPQKICACTIHYIQDLFLDELEYGLTMEIGQK